MEMLYLSKRDITTLLAKLDSVRNGEVSACTIIKNDTAHPLYPQTLRRISVTAVEAQDGYLKGVSPRLQLSHSTLTSLLDHLGKQLDAAIRIDDMTVCAVPDERYYADRGLADIVAVGDLGSAFSRNRGKQN